MISKTILPFLLIPSLIFAEENSAASEEMEMTPEEAQAAYKAYINELIGEDPYLTGDVEVPGGMATLHLPSGYRFLPADGAKKVLVDLWGNPPQAATDTLGMILPEGQEIDSEDSWSIIVEFEGDGYVSDDDADEIDYDELLSQLQQGARESNKARVEEGYESIDIVGWAVPPRYDKERKVLYWAKELKFEGEDLNTINYDVRVLGRRGVLNLQAIASIDAVPQIDAATSQIVDMVEYKEGHRYADFDPATDKKSDMSLAGMVLGGAVAAKLAAKAGFFAKFGKLFIVAGIAIAAFFKKIIGRKNEA